MMKEYKIDLSMYDGKVREVVSEAIQTKAFELGYRWRCGGIEILHFIPPWIYFELNGNMLREVTMSAFERNQNPEISAADFLALTPESVKDAPEFKPFDRVLVRDSDNGTWRANFFSHIFGETFPYECVSSCWKHCIPYEGNEHLLGTTESL